MFGKVVRELKLNPHEILQTLDHATEPNIDETRTISTTCGRALSRTTPSARRTRRSRPRWRCRPATCATSSGPTKSSAGWTPRSAARNRKALGSHRIGRRERHLQGRAHSSRWLQPHVRFGPRPWPRTPDRLATSSLR
jgi:hypothetical protein